MKKLFIILSLLVSVSSFAQQSTIGLGLGVSANSAPYGTEAYRGNHMAANYAVGVTYLRNLDKTYQLGADLYVVELSRRSTVAYSWHNEIVGNDGKKFEYAHAAYSFCPVLNAKFFKWKDGNRDGYIYGGVAIGVVVARDYKTNNGMSPNSSDSYIAPDGGIGEVAGIQVGANYNVTPRIALNIQGAVRYYNLSYDAQADYYAPKKLAYGAWVYPVIAGVRYNFEFKKKINAQTGKYELVPGAPAK